MTMIGAQDVTIDNAPELVQAVREEIAKAIVGQQEVIEQVLVALFAGGHVLIEGVPGLGKTLLVRALSRAFACTSGRIQFTPDLLPADVVGHTLFDAETNRFRVRRGPVFTQLLLADEINRAPAKTQAALLEVMQERQVTIEGQTLALERPFMTLATQNPVELEGTFPLPEAQLDRFLFKVLIGYPSADEERTLVERATTGQVGDVLDVSAVNPVMSPEAVVAVSEAIAALAIEPDLFDYAVRIIRATRAWPGVAVGAGPRGGIAIMRAARAAALLQGRSFPIPDDVKAVATPCLRHRILLAPELEIEGRTPDSVLDSILDSVEAPRR